MYGLVYKNVRIVRIFKKKNCTNCFSKIVRIVRISSENVRIFVRMCSKKFWPPCNYFKLYFQIINRCIDSAKIRDSDDASLKYVFEF